MILEDGSQYDFSVWSNLSAMLRHLRHPKRLKRYGWTLFVSTHTIRTKWNDIPLVLQEVFSQAHNVHIWLGRESDTSERAFSFIKYCPLNLDAHDEITDQGDAQDWIALAELMMRPWFSRRWVIQEILLAPEATLHCGTDTVTWAQFGLAILFIEQKSRKLSRVVRESSQSLNHPDCFCSTPPTNGPLLQ
jgi:hypothetical protein